MKKNFIKKAVACSLAFAMAASTVPFAPTTADAAKAPALNKTGKVLYVNKNEVGSSFNFNVANQVKGSTYKWSVSNKAIASINYKTGVVKAKKVGTVKVYCKITLPTKKTKTLRATVVVKENAVSAKIYNPVTNIAIGEEYNFNKSFRGGTGLRATDYENWVIDEATNTAGATVTAKNGKVTATKAGSFKIKVQAYQNKTKLAAGDIVESDWLTVKVEAQLKSVAQTATSKVALTFDDNMKTSVKAENIVIKNKATQVVTAVKGLTFSEDGKVVTVETYAAFEDGANYVLTYAEKDYDFATTIGEVASVEIKTATVVENEATAVDYVLKNANGVDITDVKKANVTVEEVENQNGWYNTTDGKLTIFTKGSTAKLKVTYHTYKFDATGKEEGAVSAEATITAVDKASATVGAYKNYVIKTTEAEPSWDKVTANTSITCVDETGYLYVRALDSTNAAVDTATFTFESGDDSILLASTNSGHAVLKAVKEGSTVVVVKNANGTVLWTLPVTVKAARTATSVVLAETSVTLVNSTTISTDTVDVTVKDQHGDNYPMTATTLADPVAVTNYTSGPVVTLADMDTVQVDASAAKAGTYQFKVALSTDATKVAVLTVVVKEKPTTGATSYKIDLSATTVDSVITDTTDGAKSVSVRVLTLMAGLPIAEKACTIEVTGPDGKKTPLTDGKFEYISVSGSTLVKKAKGTYYITAKDGTTTLNKAAIVVSDTQAAPSVVVNTTTATGSYDTEANIATALKAITTVKSSTGKELTATGEGIQGVDFVANGSSVYVKSVKVAETFGSYTYLHTVTIAKTIKFN